LNFNFIKILKRVTNVKRMQKSKNKNASTFY
jgi:hypothetical protein